MKKEKVNYNFLYNQMKKRFLLLNGYVDFNEKIIEKIVLHIAVDKKKQQLQSNRSFLEGKRLVSKLTGEKPIYKQALRNIDEFNLKKGSNISLVCLLTGSKLDFFLVNLCLYILPTIPFRDFAGLNLNGIDQNGRTINFGIKNIVHFKKMWLNDDFQNLMNIRGLDISVVLLSSSSKEFISLLSKYFPFNNKS